MIMTLVRLHVWSRVSYCWLNLERADVRVPQSCKTLMLQCFCAEIWIWFCNRVVNWWAYLGAMLWSACDAVVCWWCGAVVWRLHTTSGCRQTCQRCELPPALQDCKKLEAVARNLTFCQTVIYDSFQGGFGSMYLKALPLMISIPFMRRYLYK